MPSTPYKPRHLEERPLASGHRAWFFAPPSNVRHAFPRVKVGDSKTMTFTEACRAVEDWNVKLDAWRAGKGGDAKGRRPGTLGWLISEYRDSPAFRGLRPKTQKDYRGYLDWMDIKLGRTTLRSWDRQAATKFIGKLEADEHGRLTRTGRYRLQIARLLWSWGLEQGHITENPFEGRKVRRAPVGEKQLWRQEDIDVFLASDAPEFAKRAVILGWATSQRGGDIVRMSPAHLWRGCIKIRQEKTEVLVAPPLESWRSIVEGWSDGLRPFVHGQQGEPLSVEYVARVVSRHAPRKGLTLKQLRASAAVRWWENGMPAEEIMDRTGHRQLSTLIGHYVPIGHRERKVASDE